MKKKTSQSVKPKPKVNSKQGKPRVRGNGAGTVYAYRGQYRWQYRNPAGEVLASGVCIDKRSAQNALAAVITAQDRGQLASPDRITFAAYVESWLDSSTGPRPNTLRMYRSELAYAVHVLGRKPLRDIKPLDIKSMLHTVSTKRSKSNSNPGRALSTRTLIAIRARVKAVFREAVHDQIIYVNPADAVRRVKGTDDNEESKSVALDFDQAARLHQLGEALYEARIARLWPAVFLAMSLGLRRGEVMALRWQDVDFQTRTLHVRHNLTVDNNVICLGKPKTRRSVRDIPLPKSAMTILSNHRLKQQAMWKNLELEWNDLTPVFATNTGVFTHPDNLDRALKGIINWSNTGETVRKKATKNTNASRLPVQKTVSLERRLERAVPREHRSMLEAVIRNSPLLPTISPHDLRHTAGTLMLRRGMPLEVVSRILGHAKVSITLDVYRHVLESEKRAEMIDLFPEPEPKESEADQLTGDANPDGKAEI